MYSVAESRTFSYGKQHKPWKHKIRSLRGRFYWFFYRAGFSVLFVCAFFGLSVTSLRHMNDVMREKSSDNENIHILVEKENYISDLNTRAHASSLHPNDMDSPEKNLIPSLPLQNPRRKFQEELEANHVNYSIRQIEIRNEFIHAFKAYELYAWGMDEVHPVSKKGVSHYNLALTMIESIDSMIIMGLEDLFLKCRKWVEEKFDVTYVNTDNGVNIFQVTTRVIGGLLSAYHLKDDSLFLEKAVNLADLLLPAFDTKMGIPFSFIILKSGKAYNPSWTGGDSFASEVSNMQLEWQQLTKISGNNIYADKVNNAAKALQKTARHSSLFRKLVNPDIGASVGFGISSKLNSIYECFLNHLMLNESKSIFLNEYTESVNGILDRLLAKSKPSGLIYIREVEISKKMHHRSCSIPGTLALVSKFLDDAGKSRMHMDIAEEILITCYHLYRRSPTGLSPEAVLRNDSCDFKLDSNFRFNSLRPETLESLFILWRLKRKQKYRDWGWEIFQSFKKFSKLRDAGYSAIHKVDDVSQSVSNYRDQMGSFFLSGTLKYLYLLFSEDSVLPLDKFFFNKAAHPIPISFQEKFPSIDM